MEEYREAVESLESGDVIGLEVYNPARSAEVPLTIAIPQ
jgi:hypothetical protein